jgi:hypothetical protein
MTKLTHASLTLMALLLAACPGGGTAKRSTTTAADDFKCNGRRAEYAVAGGLMSRQQSGLVEPNAGVVVTCVDSPRLEKWRLLDDGKKSASHSLTPDEFESFWSQIEDVGWRNLKDCDNPDAAPDDPVFEFTLSDDDSSVQLTCAGKELPFPFDRLRNTFDTTAAPYAD